MTQKPEANSELEGYRRMAGEVYEILQRTRPQQEPHEYSDESKRLAGKLAQTVKRKLEREGRTLTRDPQTGRYTIVDLPAAVPGIPADPQPTPRRSFWSRLLGR